ncbi:hypothetical protein PVNG_02460 [Plasmodium vivax North Korean]|uniref:50S ribosomal protein L23 n=1 Tax=Plasmodium vivax North Korean TaxID=1035514 RepID=A0A0J9TNM5_PLAVI|nr:hypothetical protein PVNG_02460 [Plasmodium vivax North Korean]
MEIINVIKGPYFSHKKISVPSQNKFVLSFVVDQKSNKIMIKKAFKAVFGIKVLDVNTVIRKPKPARITRYTRKNFTKSRKIALISLLKEDFLSLKRALEGEEASNEVMSSLEVNEKKGDSVKNKEEKKKIEEDKESEKM